MTDRQKMDIENLLNKAKLAKGKKVSLLEIKNLLETAMQQLDGLLDEHNRLLDKLTDTLADISDDETMEYLIDDFTDVITKMDEDTIEMESALDNITAAIDEVGFSM